MTTEELIKELTVCYEQELFIALNTEDVLRASVKFYKTFSILLTKAIGHKDRRIAELEGLFKNQNYLSDIKCGGDN